MNIPELPSEKKQTSARATKEKIILGLPVAIGVGYLLLSNIAFVVSLLSNTLTAIFFALAIFAIAYVLLDGQFRNVVWYIYKMIMRKVIGGLVEIDPVSIVKTYIAEMKQKRDEMYNQIANLNGQIKRLDALIESNKTNIHKNLAAAQKAEKTGMNNLAFLKVRRAGKIEQSTLRIGDLRDKMNEVLVVLKKMYEASGYVIEDAEEDVNLQIREFEAMTAGHSAFKSAVQIIRGNPDKIGMFEQAMDAMADSIHDKKGEMELFLDMSDGFLKSIDLDQQIFEDKGFELLEKYSRGDSVLLDYKQTTSMINNQNAAISSSTYKSKKYL